MKTPKEWARECMSRMAIPGAEWGPSDVIEVILIEALAEAREECAALAEKWVDPEHAEFRPEATGCTAAFNEGLMCGAPEAIAKLIRAKNDR